MKIENMLLISRFIVFWFTHPLPDQTQTHKPTKISVTEVLSFCLFGSYLPLKKNEC